MILEHAVLDVAAGQTSEYEAALRRALPLIAATPGFIGLEVRPSIEKLGRYLLLVRWEQVEDHEQGFRGSERYVQWKALLHHFYSPFPAVEHYGEAIASR